MRFTKLISNAFRETTPLDFFHKSMASVPFYSLLLQYLKIIKFYL